MDARESIMLMVKQDLDATRASLRQAAALGNYGALPPGVDSLIAAVERLTNAVSCLAAVVDVFTEGMGDDSDDE